MSEIVKTDVAKLRTQLEQRLPSVPLFELSDIPDVMRSRMGWPVAAAMMDRWFRSSKFEMSLEMKRSTEPPCLLHQLHEERLDEKLIKMKWALGFARVQTALRNLQTNWSSKAGLELLHGRISRQGFGKSQSCWRFGNLSRPVKEIDNICQVNKEPIGALSDPMDDFYAAMGQSTLKVAVSGIVTSDSSTKFSIEIDELGFYLKDAYDFNDDLFLSQPLGFWGFKGVERTPRFTLDVFTTPRFVNSTDIEEVRGRTYLVHNKHFRLWREQHGRGGDFVVVSDLHRVRLPQTIKYSW
ncbi:DUF6402 family protein [Acidovorax sp. LjRoot194]|uniref:DUF6402 family protein n=1 Tax=Acidovorax sp. LjRoot194 TaxID=3342280 RepID=UPI003ECEB727